MPSPHSKCSFEPTQTVPRGRYEVAYIQVIKVAPADHISMLATMMQEEHRYPENACLSCFCQKNFPMSQEREMWLSCTELKA